VQVEAVDSHCLRQRLNLLEIPARHAQGAAKAEQPFLMTGLVMSIAALLAQHLPNMAAHFFVRRLDEQLAQVGHAHARDPLVALGSPATKLRRRQLPLNQLAREGMPQIGVALDDALLELSYE